MTENTQKPNSREIKTPDIKGVQDYVDRIYKLIPSELTAGYIAAQSFLGVPDDPRENIPQLIGFGLFLSALVPLYLRRIQGVTNISQIVISTISLPIWAANISIGSLGLVLPDWAIRSLGLVLIGWVLTTPVIVSVPKPLEVPPKSEPTELKNDVSREPVVVPAEEQTG